MSRPRNQPRVTIPPKAQEHLKKALLAIGDPALEASVKGRHCYVYHNGDPLCRLGYTGDVDVWEHAIYRFSTGGYSNSDPFMIARGSVNECVVAAMKAYDLR